MSQEISSSRTLHRLIYSSRQAFAADQSPDAQIDALIRASIRNNRVSAITGLLLVHDGWFVQALEGPAEAVMTTYQRILNDPRHTDSRLVSAGPGVTREFGDWNMCVRRLSATDNAILDALSQRKAFDPSALTDTSALRLLTAVRGIQDRAALSA